MRFLTSGVLLVLVGLALASSADAQRIDRFSVGLRLGDAHVDLAYHDGAARAVIAPRYGRRGPAIAPATNAHRGGYHRVWVPARARRVWVEPVHGIRYDSCGRRSRVLVRGGYWTVVHEPGHWATRPARSWRGGWSSAWR